MKTFSYSYRLLTILSCILSLTACSSGSSPTDQTPNNDPDNNQNDITDTRSWQLFYQKDRDENYQTLGIANNGDMYLGYSNTLDNDATYIERYNGAGWQSFNGVANENTYYQHIALSNRQDSIPYIVYSNHANKGITEILQEDNRGGYLWWYKPTDAAFSDKAGFRQDIVIGSSNIPYVADMEQNQVIVKCFSDMNIPWEQIGGGAISEATGPSLAFDFNQNQIYVAVENIQTHSISVLTGDTNRPWTIVGNKEIISDPNEQASHPSLLSEPNSTLLIAFTEGSHITIKTFDTVTNQWRDIGSIAEEGSYPHLALAADGTLYLAYQSNITYNIKVKAFTNNTWKDVGDAIITGGHSMYQLDDFSTADGGFALAIAPDNTPYLAFKDYLSNGTSIMAFTE